MLTDSEHMEKLLRNRQNLVQQLTDLNASHIRTQTQLAGIELNLGRCREAIDRGDETEDYIAAMAQYEQEMQQIEVARTTIDQQREALNEELQSLDVKMTRNN